MRSLYSDIVDLQRDGRPGVVVTVVAGRGHVPTEVGAKALVDASGLLAGTVGGGAIEKRALETAAEVLRSGTPLLREYVLDDRDEAGDAEPTGMLCGGRVTLFYEHLGPADRAYVFGAGHIGRALRHYLQPLGFDVVLVDCRPEQLADVGDPQARAADDYAALPDLPGYADSFVVIATHSHACDGRILEQLVARGDRPRYLGMVASRRKRERMLSAVRDGADDPTLDLDWVHVPVGLQLGGNTPAAVALSIAAEIQACRHGIPGHAHLKDR